MTGQDQINREELRMALDKFNKENRLTYLQPIKSFLRLTTATFIAGYMLLNPMAIPNNCDAKEASTNKSQIVAKVLENGLETLVYSSSPTTKQEPAMRNEQTLSTPIDTNYSIIAYNNELAAIDGIFNNLKPKLDSYVNNKIEIEPSEMIGLMYSLQKDIINRTQQVTPAGQDYWNQTVAKANWYKNELSKTFNNNPSIKKNEKIVNLGESDLGKRLATYENSTENDETTALSQKNSKISVSSTFTNNASSDFTEKPSEEIKPESIQRNTAAAYTTNLEESLSSPNYNLSKDYMNQQLSVGYHETDLEKVEWLPNYLERKGLSMPNNTFKTIGELVKAFETLQNYADFKDSPISNEMESMISRFDPENGFDIIHTAKEHYKSVNKPSSSIQDCAFRGGSSSEAGYNERLANARMLCNEAFDTTKPSDKYLSQHTNQVLRGIQNRILSTVNSGGREVFKPTTTVSGDFFNQGYLKDMIGAIKDDSNLSKLMVNQGGEVYTGLVIQKIIPTVDEEDAKYIANYIQQEYGKEFANDIGRIGGKFFKL